MITLRWRNGAPDPALVIEALTERLPTATFLSGSAACLIYAVPLVV
jgi:hypothetical protein